MLHKAPADQKLVVDKVDVVIVGAGPIGLAHAWGLKKLNPSLNIVVLEKYEEYQRKHTLVMQYQRLQELIRVTGSEKDPDLLGLLQKLKNDPHIRTNELEEIFKKRAKDLGVHTVYKEVKEDTAHRQIVQDYPDAKLIIGADGTHSVVNRSLFPKDNQVKHEFDYVLQLRYEIDNYQGEKNSPKKSLEINSVAFYQQMAARGLVANEYVGRSDGKKTPVTMQMMISKKDFNDLKSATSKDPIFPFAYNEDAKDGVKNDCKADLKANVIADGKADLKADARVDDKVGIRDGFKADVQDSDVGGLLKSESPTAKSTIVLPENLRKFINRYLAYKIKTSGQNRIDKHSIRISVNEAPATHAKQVANLYKEVPVILVGDAGLGLSYFKGLNAGLESTAKFLSLLAPAIKAKQGDNKNEIDKNNIHASLLQYQEWFLKDFSPKKVKEVGQYSTWRIRSAMLFMRIMRSIKQASLADFDDELNEIVADYFKLLAKDPLALSNVNDEWRAFPHRQYDPIKLGQFDYIPIAYTLNKIKKIFVDYIKPYKSRYHLIQDFKQPLVGFVNVMSGLSKLLSGLFMCNIERFGDGLFSLLRGAVEIGTTPLTWVIKPIIRGVVSWIREKPKIESNKGIRKLAQYGKSYLEKNKGLLSSSPKKVYELLAICNDLHRKFGKALRRGQESDLAMDEYSQFSAVRTNVELEKEKFEQYFSLFAKKQDDQKARAGFNRSAPIASSPYAQYHNLT